MTLPFVLILIYAAGAIESQFQQIGDDIQLTTLSDPESAVPQAAPRSQPRVAANPWNPEEVLAPYARIFWVTIAAAVAGVLLAAFTLTVMQMLPRRRYRKVTGATADRSEPQNVFAKRQQLLRILSNDVNALFEGRLEVRHVMTRRPLMITPDQSLESACELMDSNNVHHLVVCDHDGFLVGLLSHHFARRSTARTVAKAMLTEPVTVRPGALLNPTVTQMINAGVSCVAVMAEGYCVGILTTADVQLTLQCALALLFRATNADAGDDSPPDKASARAEHPVNLDKVLSSVRPGEYQTVD